MIDNSTLTKVLNYIYKNYNISNINNQNDMIYKEIFVKYNCLMFADRIEIITNKGVKVFDDENVTEMNCGVFEIIKWLEMTNGKEINLK